MVAQLKTKGQNQVATYGLSVSRSLTIHFRVDALFVKIRPIIFYKSFIAFSGARTDPDIVNVTRIEIIPIIRFL